MNGIMEELETIIADRRANRVEGSYTCKLFAAGRSRIAQKVGEEAVETVVAALAQDDGRVAAEVADLIYHLLVLLADCGLNWADVEAALAQRRR